MGLSSVPLGVLWLMSDRRIWPTGLNLDRVAESQPVESQFQQVSMGLEILRGTNSLSEPTVSATLWMKRFGNRRHLSCRV